MVEKSNLLTHGDNEFQSCMTPHGMLGHFHDRPALNCTATFPQQTAKQKLTNNGVQKQNQVSEESYKRDGK